MNIAGLPTFQATPVEDIPRLVAGCRSTFYTHKTRSIDFRLVQLRKLYWGQDPPIPVKSNCADVLDRIKDNETAILEACKKDLGKSFFEAQLAEITWLTNDIIVRPSSISTRMTMPEVTRIVPASCTSMSTSSLHHSLATYYHASLVFSVVLTIPLSSSVATLKNGSRMKKLQISPSRIASSVQGFESRHNLRFSARLC